MAAPTSPQLPALSAGRHAAVMLALILATVLASLDSSFVPIAFPDLIDDLDTSTGIVVWVALGYLIAATGPMLFFARVGDQRGYSRLFWIGITLYSAAMAACAMAPDIRSLIAIRLVQGVGMGIFLPATFSIATRIYPPEQRGKALGILTSANATGFILGPIFAGWLLDAYDWRALFTTRIPFALLTVALAFVAVRPRWVDGEGARRGHLDLKGAIFLTLSIFGLLFGLNRLPAEDNHLDFRVWLVFLAGLFFFFAFLRTERRSESPLINLELYRESPGFTKASIAFGALFASFPAYLFVLPLVLISGMELKAWDAGLLLGLIALITFVVSPWAGRLSDRLGEDLLCSLGAASTLLGFLLLLGVQPQTSVAYLLLPMSLFGVGSGLFFSPNNRLMMSSVPPAQAGMAAGMIGTVRQSGYALGFAFMASVFTLIQDLLERNWIRSGLEVLSVERSLELTAIFEAGGIWSPEVLVYILHVGSILGAGLLLVSLVYSLPQLRISGRRHWLVLASASVAVVLGVGSYVALREVQPRGMLEAPSTAAGLGAAVAPPAPFGMARRAPVEVAGAQPVSLGSGRAVFTFYCADCHGVDGRGIAGRGANLLDSNFVAEISDRALAVYLREGRQVDDPRNRTGQAMPGMKNFADFGTENYRQVIAFLRQLRGETANIGAAVEDLESVPEGPNS